MLEFDFCSDSFLLTTRRVEQLFLLLTVVGIQKHDFTVHR